MSTKTLIRTLALVTMLAAACSKAEKVDPTDPNVSVPDPDGTVTLSMRNANSGKTYLENSNIYIDKADNFTGGSFVSLGRVKGLGNVSYIPRAGWISQTAVVPGEGYVAYASGKFYRIYVTGYTTNIANEIIGAEIRYQAPFGGADEAVAVPKTSVTFESGGGTEEVLFSNKSIIPCTIKAEGCTATPIYVEGNSFLPQGVRITAAPNNSTAEVKGKVTISAVNGKSTEIAVTVKGSAPYIDLGEAVSLDCAAVTRRITFRSNISESELTFSSSADSWCKVDYEGESILLLTISENTTASDRTATITVSSKDGKTKGELKVTQAKLDFTLSQTTLDFDRKAAKQSVTLLPIDFVATAKSKDSWCSCSVISNVIEISAAANTTSKNRTTTITVTAKGISKTITINQNRYAVGDYYKEGNLEGVIYTLISGFHGGIISMDETWAQWSTEEIVTGATDLNNGQNNMNKIRAITNWYEKYPAFAWCEAKNTSGVTEWYLPAKNELLTVHRGIGAINATLQAKGGTSLSDYLSSDDYCSSSEYSSSRSWYVHLSTGVFGGPGSANKSNQYRVRSVAAF